jgi:hypothetical protein
MITRFATLPLGVALGFPVALGLAANKATELVFLTATASPEERMPLVTDESSEECSEERCAGMN